MINMKLEFGPVVQGYAIDAVEEDLNIILEIINESETQMEFEGGLEESGYEFNYIDDLSGFEETVIWKAED